MSLRLDLSLFEHLAADPLQGKLWVRCAYWEDWKTNGNETSTDPPEGAGKRQRAMSDLMQLATSASPRVSCSTSTPETVPACVMVQWITIFPLRLGLRLRPRS